ncbi:MAG: GMC family oxidoreductase, partial [Bacteroidia bacterium]|nr:GMC family oxidoreductase [Bacteroidia bacterium]
AEATGNLTIRPNSIVSEIVYDKDSKKASSVRVIDRETREEIQFFARVIFCNASTIGTAAILLNSRSESFPNGLGNSSGELGHNIMDHHYGMGVAARVPGFEDRYSKGRKPGGFYIPRFRNIDEHTKRQDYVRGFGYQGGIKRGHNNPDGAFGKELKEGIFKPGPYYIYIVAFGEILPHHDNKMFLNFEKRDQYGMPTITFDAELRENELTMREDAVNCAVEMLEAAGCEDIESYNNVTAPGACIHEMGTARMGHDPKTSVLNKWNQMHEVPNVFVTDGACMTSSGTQNPSITYMALTARAVDYADRQIKEGKL